MSTSGDPNRKRMPLLGGLPKLNRGDDHLKALMADMEQWLGSEPYLLDPQRTDDHCEYRLHAHVPDDKLPPILEWALVTGDALSNYRGALDQMVYTLAALNTDLSEPPDAHLLSFPIATSKSKFEKMGRSIEQLPPELRMRIESVQPYLSDRYETVAHHPLVRLRDLNNIDKHRLLHFAVLNVTLFEGEFKVQGSMGEDPGGTIWVNTEPLEQGAPVVVIKFDRPTMLEETDIHLRLRIAFHPTDGGTSTGRSLPDEMNDIREEVIRLVKMFNPELRERPGSIPTAE